MSGRLLFERLSDDPRVLEAAWRDVNRNAKSLSHGIDDIQLNQFSTHAQRNLAALRLEIKNGSYKFSDLRVGALPKPDGGHRPLQIATIRDRIVQKAIEKLIRKQLNERYNIFNNPASYAYIRTEDILDYDKDNPQTLKGVRGALEKIKSYREQGYKWALKADIINFFPTVEVDMLLNEYIYPALAPDKSLNSLIKQAFSQEVQILEKTRELFNEEQVEQVLARTGLPQGSILSPLFSNVYLSTFDKQISESGYILIRYVDDFVVMTKTEPEAVAAHKLAIKTLKQLGLKIHRIGHEKTSITSSDELTFLGINFSNGNFYPSRKAIDRNIKKLQAYPKYKILTKNLQSLQMSVQAWASTYYFCSNDKAIYEELNYALVEAVEICLQKARLKPISKMKTRELRRLGIQKFDNAIVTFNQKKPQSSK